MKIGDRVILHSDINCCYASIEHLHHPELAGKPLAVGGDPEARHGIVLTADYMAKKRGVKTGMALWQAKQVCPEINFISPRMDLYLRFSRMAHEIYGEYTDRQEPYGIDECWLDVTDSVSLKGDGEKIAAEISNRMKSELGITVSIGVSFNKIFAKLGSDYKKPDAITTMYRNEYRQKAWPLPASDLLYVGKSTAKKLSLIGVKTIGDLATMDEKILHEIISGHRRKYAAERLGYKKIPVIIRMMQDDEAVVTMVDSNLQREQITPSEKAYAYKMKYDAIKKKAGRKNCGQVDHNTGKRSIDVIGELCGDSAKQVQRYIKMTELIPAL